MKTKACVTQTGIMLKALVVSICLSSAIGVQLKYTSCGSTADVHSIIFEPCDHEECIILPGHTYNASVSFTAKMHHEKAYNHAIGIIHGLSTPEEFYTITREACGNGVNCPIEPGVTQTYTASVTCPQTNPKRMAAKWQVTDEQDRIIFCFVFPVTIP